MSLHATKTPEREKFEAWAKQNAPFMFDDGDEARLVRATAWLAYQEASAATSQAEAGDAKPVAYLHIVRVVNGEPGETDQALSFQRDSFPLKDSGLFVSLKAEPLYRAKIAKAEAVDADAWSIDAMNLDGSYTQVAVIDKWRADHSPKRGEPVPLYRTPPTAAVQAALERAAQECEAEVWYEGGREPSAKYQNVWEAAKGIRAIKPEDVLEGK